jgi:uncharacterized tellurite resistance protein B-like protein
MDRIKQFFTTEINSPDGDISHQHQLAAASLMVEVMVIDRHLDSAELSVIKQLLEQQFELDDDEISQLILLAQKEVDEATSLFQFTRLVNDHFDRSSKKHLMKSLWQVAFADTQLDKHEEAIIRRIAELIHLSHSDFIRSKHEAKQSLGKS